MFKRVFAIIIVISALSCAQNLKSKLLKKSIERDIEEKSTLLKHLETLSSNAFEGRKTGTKGNEKAQDYIIEQFKNLNVVSFGSSYKHKFTFERQKDTISAVNVLAKIEGTEFPDKYIVISAHYDHLGISKNGDIYNGADDDASGIAALFSFAEELKKNPPKHSVVLAAFDAEEMGLQGAKYFVDKMKGANIIANLNMDMISRSSKNELYVVGSRYKEGLQALINDFKNPTDTKLLIGHDGSDGKQDWTFSSDHGPFHLAKIPFLYFGNEDHAAYHKPTDVFSDITPKFYKNAVTIIMKVFKDLDTKGL